MVDMANTVRVAFDMNDGQSPRKIWTCEEQSVIGPLPRPSIQGLVFMGWYTKPEAGQGVRFTSRDAVDRSLTLYAHWGRARQGVQVDGRGQNTWVNDDKSQHSLMLGSDGYDDYIEDLAENSVDNPDDEMHAQLEAYNEDLASELAERASLEADPDKTAKIARRQEKQAIAGRIYGAAELRTRSTATRLDDAILERLEISNDLVYDDSITPDKLDDAVDGLVFGG